MGKEFYSCDCIVLQKKPSAIFFIDNFCFEYKNHLACAVRARSYLDIINPICDELSVLGLINPDNCFCCITFCK